MADAGLYFGGDLLLSATGDLLAVDSVLESNQRILRRLLTNAGDYIWQLNYGAGLPKRIGSTMDENELRSLITSQMQLEQSVLQNPPPQILLDDIGNGFEIDITYVEQDSKAPVTLSFDVSP
jgi:hypothetical protein